MYTIPHIPHQQLKSVIYEQPGYKRGSFREASENFLELPSICTVFTFRRVASL